MAEPFVGEIMMFGGNFAPRGYAFCDGSLLAISGNEALFSLLGTQYGGDGRTTFGVPDLAGRVPIHQGHGSGLTDRRIGTKSGTENEVLNVSEMPAHTHQLNASNARGTQPTPGGAIIADRTRGEMYYAPATWAPPLAPAAMASNAIGNAGGSQQHENMQPSGVINYCIALVGIYPSRS